MQSSHLTYARDCTVSDANTTPQSPYHYFYRCHQAPDDRYQFLGSGRSPPSSRLLTNQTPVEAVVVDCH